MTNLEWISSSRIYSDEDNLVLLNLEKVEIKVLSKLNVLLNELTIENI